MPTWSTTTIQNTMRNVAFCVLWRNCRGDVESIRDVNKCAFGQDLEGKIVDAAGSQLIQCTTTLPSFAFEGFRCEKEDF